MSAATARPGSQNGRAIRRPAAPIPIGPQPPALRQRDLQPGDPLRQALATLALAALPRSIRELHTLVTEQHPRPERSWTWELAAAYRQVFAAITTAAAASPSAGQR